LSHVTQTNENAWLVLIRAVTPWYEWHDACICASYLLVSNAVIPCLACFIHMCELNPWHVRHDSSMCVTLLVYCRVKSCSVYFLVLFLAFLEPYELLHVQKLQGFMEHGTNAYASWLIRVCDMLIDDLRWPFIPENCLC